jgi:hypothetical protein
MGHHFDKSVIVVALDPDDFDFAFGIREFSDERKKVPVLFLQAPKIEIAEDVAKQDQSTKVHAL